MGPAIKGNPLQIFGYLLIISYVVGEFLIPKYSLFTIFNLTGVICLVLSLALFFSASEHAYPSRMHFSKNVENKITHLNLKFEAELLVKNASKMKIFKRNYILKVEMKILLVKTSSS